MISLNTHPYLVITIFEILFALSVLQNLFLNFEMNFFSCLHFKSKHERALIARKRLNNTGYEKKLRECMTFTLKIIFPTIIHNVFYSLKREQKNIMLRSM